MTITFNPECYKIIYCLDCFYLINALPMQSQNSIQLFNNRFLESLTHIHPLTPFVVYIPIFSLFGIKGIAESGWLDGSLSFFGGFIFWTLLEYILHRFAFHYNAKTNFGKRVIFLFHGIHHDSPTDATRLVMPLSVSAPLAFIVASIFYVFIGKHAFAAFAGLGLGYLLYDGIHFACHHFPMKGRVGAFLKSYHARHHFKDQTKGFGVSNPLWDFVFGTYPQR